MNSQATTRRVVITGLGIISPVGIGRDAFWSSLQAGKSGIAPVQMFDCSIIPGGVAGEIKDFTDETVKKIYLKAQRKSIKVMCRDIQLGVASASLAMEDAKLDPEQINHERFGVEFGANLMLTPPETLTDPNQACLDADQKFVFERWGTEGLGDMEPLWLLKYLPNMPACHIGINVDARGPNNSITLEDASANLALREAGLIIARGWADVMIAGATGARVHPVKAIHTLLWNEFASEAADPLHCVKPFDVNRCGTALGEGSCTLILEEEQHARSRGAQIRGTLLGAGSSAVADKSGKPDIRKCVVNAMRAALRMSGLQPTDIGHINAHGLGGRESDLGEAQAIHDVFGDYGRKVPVVGLKGFWGNSGAGDGGLELAASLLALKQGCVPFTLNTTDPDPACGLNIVRDKLLPTDNKVVMNVNFTRIGQGSVVIVRGE
ncbi:MAG: beta-ketoacyl-[acyl-carrier-protein] synthase family protein [Planctomycetaceae bacterium]|nr:beta-ketoacyl-[acyl-carrier-protein] synthase family protein [Planctomycetaceae bacterium]